jgi:hypothetical protein
VKKQLTPSQVDAASGGIKSPYSKPRLETYGDLKEITQTVANRTRADGGTPVNASNRTN